MLGLINSGVNAVVNATESGTLFIFGYLGGDPLNVDYPFSISEPGATMILAFRISAADADVHRPLGDPLALPRLADHHQGLLLSPAQGV